MAVLNNKRLSATYISIGYPFSGVLPVLDFLLYNNKKIISKQGHKQSTGSLNSPFSILLIILLFTLSGCFQQETDNSSSMHWIEDKSGALSFDEIIKKDLSTQWNQVQQRNPNFGFTKNTIWLNLPIENTKDERTSMLLEIAFPLHDRIDIYLLNKHELIKSYHTGDQYPFSQRPLNHRNFLFPFTAPPKEKLQAVIRIQSTDTMYIPIKVWESNQFFTQDQHELLFLGIAFGFLSIMLIYNLFLYISTQHRNYLYYSWFTASIIYLQITQKSLGYQYLWPNQPFFNHLSVPLANFIMIATSSFFILKFLELEKTTYSKALVTSQTLVYIGITGIISTTIIFNVSYSATTYLGILTITAVLGAIATIAMISMLISLSIRGYQSAKILSIAWLSLLAGSLLFVLGRLGFPMPMLLTENAMLIGSTFEAALISFALAKHIKKERDGRMHAQEQALLNERKTREAQNSLIKLQNKTTQQLEHEVKERTFELEIAMENLTSANQKLDSLVRLDGLTGLSNRRNFDQVFEREWNSSLQQKRPISLLMADIDHFKNINDTYGHLFGDQCLIEAAATLKKCMSRPENLVARYGGEEFIIMLPNTHPINARHIAEDIRFNIEKLRLNYEGHNIHFTISIGIANKIPTSDIKSIDLIAAADQALYLAKEEGRNRVVLLDAPRHKNICKPNENISAV